MKKTSLTVAGIVAAMALAFGANAKTKPTPEPTPENPIMSAVSSYILLDRTGSMSDIWDEALGSVNAYAEAGVVARLGEHWSAPCAIGTGGVSWGGTCLLVN